MAVNRGKQFEDAIESAFKKCTDVSIDRFADPAAGYAGIRNICDFVVYSYPFQYYFECKSCYGNTLSIYSNNPDKRYSNITNNQWEGLVEKSVIPGVEAGVIVWFIDHDVTAYVPIEHLAALRNNGAKSLNIKDLVNNTVPHIRVPGRKKRVLFEYDAFNFLTYLYYLSRTNKGEN